ncbi:MAG TPA: hypothetical protein VG844_15850 [Terracidiphilus sp.]|nr:hypothetical protein [Terracidiphilus sp.]
MRATWAVWATAAMVTVAAQSMAVKAQTIAEPAAQLVREVVANELNDHARHGFWRYWIASNDADGRRVSEQIETAQGPVRRLLSRDGHELSEDAEQDEEERLRSLASSETAQAHRLQSYEEDERRVGRILALLPDAFVYADDGMVNGQRRLRFRPNPAYDAHGVEARIFHAMKGELVLDPQQKRLIRLEGRLSENVDFGFGLLGRLNKGGWFLMERTAVSASEWKTVRLEIHMTGRALMVKAIARETSETRGGFTAVPAGLSTRQAAELLASPAAAAAILPARFSSRP